MAFRVELEPQAFADLDAIATYIRERSSFRQAERWFNGILAAIRSLSEMPERCPVAEESSLLGAEVRVLLFGRTSRQYKIYFAVHNSPLDQRVRVFHIRHWARREPDGDELEDLMDEALNE